MEFLDSPQEAEFRRNLRAWLVDNLPPRPYPDNHGREGHDFTKQWHRTVYSGGWLGLSWPEEYGGQGLGPAYDAIVNQELGAVGAPSISGMNFLGRPLVEFGTPEQCATYLPGMLSGQTSWCQGFSEPGAGSDLASLSTRADLEGDEYLVNGQKVWTSGAPYADYCLLLCRTNQEVPKHRGISCLVVAMDTPGITVRPLREIWGSADFSEVFFDDVRVPVAQRIGKDGDGWPIATNVMAYERGPADIGFIASFGRLLNALAQRAEESDEMQGRRMHERIAEAYLATEACRVHVMKSLTRRSQGLPPGPETSIDKMLMTRAEQELGGIDLDMSSAETLVDDDGTGRAIYEYLWSRSASIYGGAEQIQRTIIAQRVLGLPRGK